MDVAELPVAFYFQVSMVDAAHASEIVFQEISGLAAKIDVEPVVEGGENRIIHHLPSAVKHNNLILKRGLLPANSMLVKWCRDTLDAGLSTQVITREMTVSLINEDGLPVAQWMITSAYPVKWLVASVQAEDEKLVIETIELAYSTATRIQ